MSTPCGGPGELGVEPPIVPGGEEDGGGKDDIGGEDGVGRRDRAVRRLADVDPDGDQEQRRQHEAGPARSPARTEAGIPSPRGDCYRIRGGPHSGQRPGLSLQVNWRRFAAMRCVTVTLTFDDWGRPPPLGIGVIVTSRFKGRGARTPIRAPLLFARKTSRVCNSTGQSPPPLL